ncbi:MAG: hypothetical protein QNK23_01600 [Crocinitomicaceae bacterium]|nr:hypothetical protein [Crocinitomicaceae bacterium]
MSYINEINRRYNDGEISISEADRLREEYSALSDSEKRNKDDESRKNKKVESANVSPASKFHQLTKQEFQKLNSRVNILWGLMILSLIVNLTSIIYLVVN